MHLKMQLDWSEWKHINDANNKLKYVGMAIFKSDKIDIKVNSINKENEGFPLC